MGVGGSKRRGHEDEARSHSVGARGGHEISSRKTDPWSKYTLNCDFPVVGTGVDPVTSRFSSMKERRFAQAAPARRDGSVSFLAGSLMTGRAGVTNQRMHRARLVGQGSQGRPKAARRGNLDGPISVMSHHGRRSPSGLRGLFPRDAVSGTRATFPSARRAGWATQEPGRRSSFRPNWDVGWFGRNPLGSIRSSVSPQMRGP